MGFSIEEMRQRAIDGLVTIRLAGVTNALYGALPECGWTYDNPSGKRPDEVYKALDLLREHSKELLQRHAEVEVNNRIQDFLMGVQHVRN